MTEDFSGIKWESHKRKSTSTGYRRFACIVALMQLIKLYMPCKERE